MLHFARNYPFSIQLGLIFILHVILFSDAKAQINSTWDDTAKASGRHNAKLLASIPASISNNSQPIYTEVNNVINPSLSVCIPGLGIIPSGILLFTIALLRISTTCIPISEDRTTDPKRQEVSKSSKT